MTGRMSLEEIMRLFAEMDGLPRGCSLGSYLPKTSDLLVLALEQLGRYAHISSIAERFGQLRLQERPDLPWRDYDGMRSLAQSGLYDGAKNCNAEATYDYFTRVEKGTGYWQLNPDVSYDHKYRAARVRALK